MDIRLLKKKVATDKSINVELHAIELSLYMLFVRENDQLDPVQSPRNEALRFPSRFAALRSAKAIGLDQVEFVHKSAYDEMIGLPSAEGGAQMREKINLGKMSFS